MYPAAANPEITNVSAVWRTIYSLMLHPYLFHGFQPIGGFFPNPLSIALMDIKMTQINRYLYIK
jgi:hypothetical protein